MLELLSHVCVCGFVQAARLFVAIPQSFSLSPLPSSTSLGGIRLVMLVAMAMTIPMLPTLLGIFSSPLSLLPREGEERGKSSVRVSA